MESRAKRLWRYLEHWLKPKMGTAARARRIQIESGLRFRPVGQADWHQGLTSDISPSGVLFRADRIVDVQTPVEMTFVVPAKIAVVQGALVVCRGQIVRTIMPAARDGQPQLAVKILEYLPRTQWKPDMPQAA